MVARTFHAALGLIFVIAFASLASQIDLLFATGGLAPIAETTTLLREAEFDTSLAPSLFWWSAADSTLYTAAIAGMLCGLLALLGRLVRPCLAAATILYLGFTTLGAPFLGFQWDALLLECGLLAVLLPRGRPAPVVHLLLAFLLFKLYFESGLAKWYSPLGDWHDGSAMTFYYETAPIPTRLGWYAHWMPASWHAFEGWVVLAGELLVPLLIFAGRRARLVAFFALTGFQIVNVLTANYGFFIHLALALHLFLLRDEDLERPRRWLARLPSWLRPAPVPEASPPGRVRTTLTAAFAAFYLVISLVDARGNFSDSDSARAWQAKLAPLYAPFNMINTYHLFAAITRERIEPEFAGTTDGETWTDYTFHYKPGPLDRPPPFVAPHQPRLDFQLWFSASPPRGKTTSTTGRSGRSGAAKFGSCCTPRVEPGRWLTLAHRQFPSRAAGEPAVLVERRRALAADIVESRACVGDARRRWRLAARRLDDVGMGHHARGRVDPRCRDAREALAGARGSKPVSPSVPTSRARDHRGLPVVEVQRQRRVGGRASRAASSPARGDVAGARSIKTSRDEAIDGGDGRRGRRRRLPAHRRARGGSAFRRALPSLPRAEQEQIPLPRSPAGEESGVTAYRPRPYATHSWPYQPEHA